jgi:predicted amidohydrolase
MDAGDAYIDLYDVLADCPQVSLLEWHLTAATQDRAEAVRRVVGAAGEAPDDHWRAWLPDGATCSEEAFGVLLGLDRALLDADPYLGTPGTPLGTPRGNLQTYGRLNSSEGKGILLTRRAAPCRPSVEPESLDGFLRHIRIPPDLAGKLDVMSCLALDDLPVPDQGRDGRHGRDLAPLPLIPIAQLPMLAEPGDLIWATPDDSHYTVAPNSALLAQYVPRALAELDASGAVLALLPEASLDDHLLEAWQVALRATPGEGALTWLLAGTGPVRKQGPAAHAQRPPNRAVLLHRNGEVLLTQDKQRGFTITTENQQHKYGVPYAGSARAEYITQGTRLSVLESRRGRFAVAICEDLERDAIRDQVIKSGTTHLIVPGLAGGMHKDGWQPPDAYVVAVEAGADVAVSNGLAIESKYNGNPVPTLLVFSVPDEHDDYLSHGQLLRIPEPATVTADPRDNALTVRPADW